MKIYIVTSGVYSDYGIEAVFTEQGPADHHAAELAKMSRNEDVRVQEWDADDPEKRNLVCAMAYVAAVKKGSERIVDMEPATEMVPENERSAIVEGSEFLFRIYAKSYVSQEHARKLAAEALQKLRREQP